MQLADPLALLLSLVNLALSHLVAWSVPAFVRHLAPASINIVTHLNAALIHTYNLFLTLMCLVVGIKAVSRAVPGPVAVGLRLAIFFALSGVEGIMVAIGAVRLLFVLNYRWISGQEYERLGRRILLAVVVMGAVLFFTSSEPANSSITTTTTNRSIPAPPVIHITSKQRFEVLIAVKFLAANLCVLAAYLASGLVLYRQRVASLAILIGERSSMSTNRHLLRTRIVLIGNAFGLLTYGALLAVAILPNPFQQQRYRPLELQLHVFVMLYYAHQMKLGAFMKQKIAQKLRPLGLEWERRRKRRSRIAPLPNTSDSEPTAIRQRYAEPVAHRQGVAVRGNDEPLVANCHEIPCIGYNHETSIGYNHETSIAYNHETSIDYNHENSTFGKSRTSRDNDNTKNIATENQLHNGNENYDDITIEDI